MLDVNQSLNFGYNAGMRSKRIDWGSLFGLLLSALVVYFLFAGKPDPSKMTDEQRADAAYEHRAGQMQN